MAAQRFEPMSVGGIIDRAFRLYRANFVRFITIVAIVQVPMSLLAIVVSRATQAPVDLNAAARSDPAVVLQWAGIQLGGAVIVGVISIMAASLCSAALAKGVSESYLGREVTVGQAYRFVLPRFSSLVGAALLVAVITGLGFVLLVAPGVIFSVWFALTLQVIVLEGRDALPAMGRSRSLVAGNFGKVVLVGLVLILINLVVWSIFTAPAALPMFRDPQNPQSIKTFTLVSQLSSVVAQVLTAPVGASAMILLYYDLRIRKEGFDLEMLAESLGVREMPPDAAPPVH